MQNKLKQPTFKTYQCLYCEGDGCEHCFNKGYVGPVRHKLQCHELNIEVIYPEGLEC